MGTRPVIRITEQEYLAADRAADYKSEFVAGEMYAMSGGTARHSHLGVRVVRQLDSRLEGSSCTTFNSDMRIRSPRGEHFYPDASVVCGPIETQDGGKDICTNPVLIAEVLSPSTANYDRGMKFVLYRQIPTLMEYLIFHCDSIHAEHYSRSHDGSWVLREYRGDDARIPLPSVQCEIHLGSIYAGVMELPG